MYEQDFPPGRGSHVDPPGTPFRWTPPEEIEWKPQGTPPPVSLPEHPEEPPPVQSTPRPLGE